MKVFIKRYSLAVFILVLANGQLDEKLQEAAELTYQEMNALEEQGYQPHESWEMTREKYLILPEEKGLSD